MNKLNFDYVVVGAGCTGSAFARVAADAGNKVLVIDKRNHVAGNCYTKNMHGIEVHMYGAHIFHTNNTDIWNFVNRFAKFNNYKHTVKAMYRGKLYSFPINLMTFNQLYGYTLPRQAEEHIERVKIKLDKISNLEDWCLSQVGTELYQIFIKEYTTKQWGLPPFELSDSIIKRIPFRLNYNDRYFNDKYEGIPENGYTNLFENMLDHENITVELGVDYLENKKYFNSKADKIIYTGRIDEYFEFNNGVLNYRSLEFQHNVYDMIDFQGTSVVNYTDDSIMTRTIEHKHFSDVITNKTVVTTEIPVKENSVKLEPYYPIQSKSNMDMYNVYKKLCDEDLFKKRTSVYIAGRLGTYKYIDMHQAMLIGIKLFNQINNRKES